MAPGASAYPPNLQKKVSAREARMDPLPEWTVCLTGAVQRARVLSDLGIFPLQRWKLTGRCSWHGLQSLTVETTDLLGGDILSGYLQCHLCETYNQVKRWLPITESRLLREGEK